MKKPTLKPCPFGCRTAKIIVVNFGLNYWIQCQLCQCRGPWRESEAEAKRAWNRRLA